LVLGEVAYDTWKVKNKEIKAPYIPLYRNPDTVRGGSKKKPTELKIHFTNVLPKFPLKSKTFADSKKPSMIFELDLKPEVEVCKRIKNFFKKRDDYINEVLRNDPRFRDLVEEGPYRLMPRIGKGKKKKDSEEKNNDFVRFPIEWNGGNKKWSYSLFYEGVLTDSPLVKQFLEDESFKRYKSNIGIKINRLTFMPSTKNIYYKERLTSINLPTKLPDNFETDQDRCLPGCRIQESSSAVERENANDIEGTHESSNVDHSHSEDDE